MAAKTRDLSRQVYTRLREAILSSELLPGHKLSHQALAERLGVTRHMTESYSVGGFRYTSLTDAIAQARRMAKIGHELK